MHAALLSCAVRRTAAARCIAAHGGTAPLTAMPLYPDLQGYNAWLRDSGERSLTAFGTAFMWAGALHAAYVVAVPAPLRASVARRNARLAMVSVRQQSSSGMGGISSRCRCPSPAAPPLPAASCDGTASARPLSQPPPRAAVLARRPAGGRLLRPPSNHPP